MESGKTFFKSRWLLNLALIVLVTVLALFAIYKGGQENTETGPPLTTLATDHVTRIRIDRPKKPRIVLAKTGDAWRLTAPYPARANQFNVDRLLRLAKAESQARFPAVSGELARYGLDKPSARVSLDDEEIIFGAMHPIKNQHYVRYRDEVHLIHSRYFAPVAYRYSNYIDTRLLEEGRTPIGFKFPAFRLTLKDGNWHRQPGNDKLTTDSINKFVQEWRHARALSVERYSKKPALGQIKITFTKNDKTETLTLAILGYKPDFILYRKDEGLEYHFPEGIGKRLLKISEE
ncbi:MAG: hypothetical protein BMS9Abin22_470 [Gammaproteobacteria bacterium]|nr:MAG: hypothetical protein BMS9Abin22_470 [Gammaproteobacteria bacterium]